MSDSTVSIYATGSEWPSSYTVKFENLGRGEISAIQAALYQFGDSERKRFDNGTSSIGECAEGLFQKMWEEQQEAGTA